MVQILLKALSTVLLKMVAVLATEKMIEWLLFKTADLAVKSTKTNLDDKFLEEFKANYEAANEGPKVK